MKLLKQIVVVLLLGWLLAQFLPWWSVAIAGGIAGFAISKKVGRAFLGGFLGIFILWAVVALLQTTGTGSDLHEKFAQLLPLPLNGTGLIFFSALIGGLAGGLGGWTGTLLRKSFSDRLIR
jgi:uncharacterized membrane protein